MGGDSNPGLTLPKQARYQLRYTRLWNCFICGLSCGLGRFLTNDFTELVPASGSVPAGCGVGLFPSWMGGICSQSKRATNCATPGYSVFLHDTTRGRKKQVSRVCGRRCGQARFFGSFSTREFPPQATVPRTSGISLSREWIGHLSSQSKRATLGCGIFS